MKVTRRVKIDTLAARMVSEFVHKTQEQRSVDDIMQRIRKNVLSGAGAFWILSREDQYPFCCGYFYAEVQENEDGGYTAVVDQALASGADRSWAKLIDKTVTEWAVSRGCTEVAFYTRRNPKAFVRALGAGWAQDSVVLKKRL